VTGVSMAYLYLNKRVQTIGTQSIMKAHLNLNKVI
jgi:hypothetical protein